MLTFFDDNMNERLLAASGPVGQQQVLGSSVVIGAASNTP